MNDTIQNTQDTGQSAGEQEQLVLLMWQEAGGGGAIDGRLLRLVATDDVLTEYAGRLDEGADKESVRSWGWLNLAEELCEAACPDAPHRLFQRAATLERLIDDTEDYLHEEWCPEPAERELAKRGLELIREQGEAVVGRPAVREADLPLSELWLDEACRQVDLPGQWVLTGRGTAGSPARVYLGRALEHDMLPLNVRTRGEFRALVRMLPGTGRGRDTESG